MVGADNLESALRHAHELHRTGRSKEAATFLVATIKERPTSAAPYRLLADIQRALGRRAAETAVLAELASLEPLDPAHWSRLASLLAERGRSEDSYRAYLRASELMPSESGNWERPLLGRPVHAAICARQRARGATTESISRQRREIALICRTHPQGTRKRRPSTGVLRGGVGASVVLERGDLQLGGSCAARHG